MMSIADGYEYCISAIVSFMHVLNLEGRILLLSCVNPDDRQTRQKLSVCVYVGIGEPTVARKGAPPHQLYFNILSSLLVYVVDW
jgi:hypothetical protein